MSWFKNFRTSSGKAAAIETGRDSEPPLPAGTVQLEAVAGDSDQLFQVQQAETVGHAAPDMLDWAAQQGNEGEETDLYVPDVPTWRPPTVTAGSLRVTGDHLQVDGHDTLAESQPEAAPSQTDGEPAAEEFESEHEDAALTEPEAAGVREPEVPPAHALAVSLGALQLRLPQAASGSTARAGVGDLRLTARVVIGEVVKTTAPAAVASARRLTARQFAAQTAAAPPAAQQAVAATSVETEAARDLDVAAILAAAANQQPQPLISGVTASVRPRPKPFSSPSAGRGAPPSSSAADASGPDASGPKLAEAGAPWKKVLSTSRLRGGGPSSSRLGGVVGQQQQHGGGGTPAFDAAMAAAAVAAIAEGGGGSDALGMRTTRAMDGDGDDASGRGGVRDGGSSSDDRSALQLQSPPPSPSPSQASRSPAATAAGGGGSSSYVPAGTGAHSLPHRRVGPLARMEITSELNKLERQEPPPAVSSYLARSAAALLVPAPAASAPAAGVSFADSGDASVQQRSASAATLHRGLGGGGIGASPVTGYNLPPPPSTPAAAPASLLGGSRRPLLGLGGGLSLSSPLTKALDLQRGGHGAAPLLVPPPQPNQRWQQQGGFGGGAVARSPSKAHKAATAAASPPRPLDPVTAAAAAAADSLLPVHLQRGPAELLQRYDRPLRSVFSHFAFRQRKDSLAARHTAALAASAQAQDGAEAPELPAAAGSLELPASRLHRGALSSLSVSVSPTIKLQQAAGGGAASRARQLSESAQQQQQQQRQPSVAVPAASNATAAGVAASYGPGEGGLMNKAEFTHACELLGLVSVDLATSKRALGGTFDEVARSAGGGGGAHLVPFAGFLEALAAAAVAALSHPLLHRLFPAPADKLSALFARSHLLEPARLNRLLRAADLAAAAGSGGSPPTHADLALGAPPLPIQLEDFTDELAAAAYRRSAAAAAAAALSPAARREAAEKAVAAALASGSGTGLSSFGGLGGGGGGAGGGGAATDVPGTVLTYLYVPVPVRLPLSAVTVDPITGATKYDELMIAEITRRVQETLGTLVVGKPRLASSYGRLPLRATLPVVASMLS